MKQRSLQFAAAVFSILLIFGAGLIVYPDDWKDRDFKAVK